MVFVHVDSLFKYYLRLACGHGKIHRIMHTRVSSASIALDNQPDTANTRYGDTPAKHGDCGAATKYK